MAAKIIQHPFSQNLLWLYCANFIFIAPFWFYRILYLMLLARRNMPERSKKLGKSILLFLFFAITLTIACSLLDLPAAKGVLLKTMPAVLGNVFYVFFWACVFLAPTLIILSSLLQHTADKKISDLMGRLGLFFAVNILAMPITLGFELALIEFVFQPGQ